MARHNGIFGGCWCIWFHPDGPERGQGAEANRVLKRSYVEAGKAHAALVLDGEEAIAWCEFGTPEELPTIHHRTQYDATSERDPDWRLTCIFVDKRYRRLGITELAIRGALDLIAEAGGGVVGGLSARPDRADQEDVVLVPLQRDPGALREDRVHLRPAQGAQELHHGHDRRGARLNEKESPATQSRDRALHPHGPSTTEPPSPMVLVVYFVRLALVALRRDAFQTLSTAVVRSSSRTLAEPDHARLPGALVQSRRWPWPASRPSPGCRHPTAPW